MSILILLLTWWLPIPYYIQVSQRLGQSVVTDYLKGFQVTSSLRMKLVLVFETIGIRTVKDLKLCSLGVSSMSGSKGKIAKWRAVSGTLVQSHVWLDSHPPTLSLWYDELLSFLLSERLSNALRGTLDEFVEECVFWLQLEYIELNKLVKLLSLQMYPLCVFLTFFLFWFALIV